jgi:hypothetical protein
MFQNILGTLPLFVGEVSDHLDNFLLDLSHNFVIGLVCGSIDIEYGASHVFIQPGQPLCLKCPRSPSGLARPDVSSYEFLKGVSCSDHAGRLVKCTGAG